jgi:CBS domain-containing membrane protein
MRQQHAAQTPITAVMHIHPYWVTAQQPVQALLSLFVDKGISAAPVVDEEGRPMGFVSKTDVIRELHRPSPQVPQEIGAQVQPWWDTERLSQLTVGEIMTPSVYTFTATTTVADATAAMAFEGVHHLPVVEASGKLMGMVSALDILDWIARDAGYTPARDKDGRIFARPVVDSDSQI